jgi:hypothetical protein
MKVVAAANKNSPVANLASWFHQDFILTSVDPDQWGNEFIKTLSAVQRRVLRVELVDLLAEYSGTSAKGITNAWVRLGAEGWPSSANLREAMVTWIKALE